MRIVLILAVAALAAACSKPSEAPSQAEPRREPIVVYASHPDEGYLDELFSAFTANSGIPVTVRLRREEQNIAEVIENRGSPPADVLITGSVHGMWKASDEGALRPLQSADSINAVSEVLRDPDSYWTATRYSTIVVAYDPDSVDVSGLASFEDLGNPEYAKKLCLAAPWEGVNRSLVAKLVAMHGVRAAEMIVRGWTANLELPAFGSETELLEALEGGRCALGILSSGAAASSDAIAVVVPEPAQLLVETIGVNRHARYPEQAQALIAWMVGDVAQEAHSVTPGFYPASAVLGKKRGPQAIVSDLNAGLAGAYDEDAMKLAERAGWR